MGSHPCAPSGTASERRSDNSRGEEVAHAGVRGAIGAMAMTGMRTLTVSLGLLRESPPEAIARQRARGLLRHVPRKRRRAVVEFVHWGYGVGGGAAFGILPRSVRDRAWAGPVYGLLSWLSFETVIAPALGLSQAKRFRPVDRLALAADHLLYGLVLSEGRRRPQH